MINRNEKQKKQTIGSILAGAVGDALGYAVEFFPYSEIVSIYGEKGIRKYDLKCGKAIISDDTQMTLFTANGILFGETRACLRGVAGYPSSYVYFAYLDWLTTQGYDVSFKTVDQSWLLRVHELHSSRAPGGTCLSALASGKMGSVSEPINQSKGCGGVMRIAPYGLFYGHMLNDEPEKFINEAMEIGAITHGNPMSHLSCALASCIIAKMLFSSCSSIKTAVIDSLDLLRKHTDFKDYDEFSYLINKALKLSENSLPDVENIRALGEGWIAEEAIAISVYCACKYQNNLIEGIIAAVNHDGDSDSTGAITGNLLGAWLGETAIPKEYLKDLELRDVIKEIATDLTTGCPMSDFDVKYDQAWGDKYI